MKLPPVLLFADATPTLVVEGQMTWMISRQTLRSRLVGFWMVYAHLSIMTISFKIPLADLLAVVVLSFVYPAPPQGTNISISCCKVDNLWRPRIAAYCSIESSEKRNGIQNTYWLAPAKFPPELIQ